MHRKHSYRAACWSIRPFCRRPWRKRCQSSPGSQSQCGRTHDLMTNKRKRIHLFHPITSYQFTQKETFSIQGLRRRPSTNIVGDVSTNNITLTDYNRHLGFCFPLFRLNAVKAEVFNQTARVIRRLLEHLKMKKTDLCKLLLQRKQFVSIMRYFSNSLV